VASAQLSGETSSIDYTLAVEPTLGGYGYLLLAFGVFNLVLFPWYYKNPAKVNWPPVVSFFIALLVMGLGIGAEAAAYYLFGNSRTGSSYWLYEGLAFGMSLILFVLFSFLGVKKAQKNFEKVDL
jgi:hypothetical protein